MFVMKQKGKEKVNINDWEKLEFETKKNMSPHRVKKVDKDDLTK